MSEPLKNTPLYARLRLAETLLEQICRQVGLGSGHERCLTPSLLKSLHEFVRLPKVDAQEDAANRKRLELWKEIAKAAKERS